MTITAWAVSARAEMITLAPCPHSHLRHKRKPQALLHVSGQCWPQSLLLPLLSQTRLTMEKHLLLEEGRKHINASGQVVLLLFSLLYKPFPADKGVL